MKKLVRLTAASSLLLCAVVLLSGSKPPAAQIQWMTFEEAIAANQKEPRKIFIDLYTSWCGWCKRMDAGTFKDPVIIELLNEDFYAVKFDAEQKADVVYNGNTFKWTDQGRRGAHQLAISLLDGKMSYPSFVFLDEEVKRMQIVKGYQQPNDLEMLLAYYGDNHYKSNKPEAFKATFKPRSGQ